MASSHFLSAPFSEYILRDSIVIFFPARNGFFIVAIELCLYFIININSVQPPS